jgi:DNA-binding transcriptional LysR family regulator
MKGVTLRQLRVLVAVARHESVTRAAQELQLTPPAVSMQLKELEQQVGTPLFDRSGRAVTLTTTGEYLLSYARRILATVQDAEDAIARLQGLQGGPLTVGMVGTAKYFVPRLITAFHLEHPGIEATFRVGDREQLLAMLERHEVDLAIMGRPPGVATLRAEPFAMQPFVLVTPPRHPFASMAQVPVARLSREGFIVRQAGSGTREVFDAFVAEHRLSPKVLMAMESNETVKQAVMADMGLALLSLHTLGTELPHGMVAVPDVEGLPIVRHWHVVDQQARLLPPAAEAFRDFLLERGEGLLAGLFPFSAAAATLRRFSLRPPPVSPDHGP